MRPSVSYEEYRRKMFEDEEFRKVWDEMQPEFEIMRAIADGRMDAGMSQRDLADKADIIQRDINRLENGNGNPTLKTLKKLASALGCRLELKFTKLPSEA